MFSCRMVQNLGNFIGGGFFFWQFLCNAQTCAFQGFSAGLGALYGSVMYMPSDSAHRTFANAFKGIINYRHSGRNLKFKTHSHRRANNSYNVN